MNFPYKNGFANGVFAEELFFNWVFSKCTGNGYSHFVQVEKLERKPLFLSGGVHEEKAGTSF